MPLLRLLLVDIVVVIVTLHICYTHTHTHTHTVTHICSYLVTRFTVVFIWLLRLVTFTLLHIGLHTHIYIVTPRPGFVAFTRFALG